MRSQAGIPLGLALRARIMVHRRTSREELLTCWLETNTRGLDVYDQVTFYHHYTTGFVQHGSGI